MKGLVEPWQFPYFCEFDQAITSVLFMELVIAVENAGPMVVATIKKEFVFYTEIATLYSVNAI